MQNSLVIHVNFKNYISDTAWSLAGTSFTMTRGPMACGTACVLTDVGGVNEYAQHEINALLVPPRRPDLFAEAILRLLDQPNLRESLVKAGLEKARHFCHRREARETLEFFRSFL